MGGKVNVYNLGEKGINLNKSPIHLDDGEVTNAQNAELDPEGGEAGLKKRLGMAKLNAIAAAGSIGGLTRVPLPLESTRTVYQGSVNSVSGAAQGWNRSTDALLTHTPITSNPAPPRGTDKVTVLGFATSAIFHGAPVCVYGNRLYYAADDYVLYPGAGHSAPPIRVFDGSVDGEIVRVPLNPDVAVDSNVLGVLNMIAANGMIYFTTLDGGATSADYRGRVFQLNPSTGSLAQLGSTFPVGYLPFCLTFYLGRLWCGTISNDMAFAGRVYYFRPGVDVNWTLDHTTDANKGNIQSITSFLGELYISTCAAVGQNSTVKRRTTAGVWSVVDTSLSAANGNSCLGLIVFEGALYHHQFDPGNAGLASVNHRLRKSTNGTAWTTQTTAPVWPLQFSFQDNGRLFFLSGSTYGGSGLNTGYYSDDGTTWTALPALSGASLPGAGVITS